MKNTVCVYVSFPGHVTQSGNEPSMCTVVYMFVFHFFHNIVQTRVNVKSKTLRVGVILNACDKQGLKLASSSTDFL